MDGRVASSDVVRFTQLSISHTALGTLPEDGNVVLKHAGDTMGHAVAQWLRHCVTNRKFVGSIPDGVI
jgi:hypothetical protein